MILDQFKLDNRVALVTGASRGLGQAMALALAEAGADIVALDRTVREGTEAAVTAAGRRFLQVQCDLRAATAADLNDIVGQVVAQFGRIDILVNNAGIIRRSPAIDYSESDWNDVIDVNLNKVFLLSQAAARPMVQQGGGKIINIASMLSYQGGITVSAYTAAKHGLAGLTRALANEWASKNINVNAIAPGYMATDNTAPLREDENRATSILARIPAARWGTPEDLMGTVVFLASDAARYMHGSLVPVDGGWLNR